jgi:hypothetical protein
LEHTGSDHGTTTHSTTVSVSSNQLSNQLSQNEGLSSVRRASGLNNEGHPAGQTPAPFHPARPIIGSAQVGLERECDFASIGDFSNAMVDREEPMEGERKRHRSPPPSFTGDSAVGCGDAQNAGCGGELIFQGKAYQTRGFLTTKEWKEKFINEFEFSGVANTVRAPLPITVVTLKDEGVHVDSIRDASSSISVACYEATDGRTQQGLAPSVQEVIAGFRRRRPTKRQNNGIHHDVAALCQEAWLHGPDSALNLGHQKEKILLSMAADTAVRPSDLSKLYRIFEGSNRQVAMLTGARPFSGPPLPFPLPVIATRSIVLPTGAESSG